MFKHELLGRRRDLNQEFVAGDIDLEADLSQVLEKTKTKEVIENEDEAIIEAELAHINKNMWDMIEPFAPFGLANPKPIFNIQNAEVYSAKNFGKLES